MKDSRMTNLTEEYKDIVKEDKLNEQIVTVKTKLAEKYNKILNESYVTSVKYYNDFWMEEPEIFNIYKYTSDAELRKLCKQRSWRLIIDLKSLDMYFVIGEEDSVVVHSEIVAIMKKAKLISNNIDNEDCLGFEPDQKTLGVFLRNTGEVIKSESCSLTDIQKHPEYAKKLRDKLEKRYSQFNWDIYFSK